METCHFWIWVPCYQLCFLKKLDLSLDNAGLDFCICVHKQMTSNKYKLKRVWPRNPQILFPTLCLGNAPALRPGVWIILLFSCAENTSRWIRGQVGVAWAAWNNCAMPHLGRRAVPTGLLETLWFLYKKAVSEKSLFCSWVVAVSFGAALPAWFWPRDPKDLLYSSGCHCCVSPAAPGPAWVRLGFAGVLWGFLYECESPGCLSITPAPEVFHSCSDQWGSASIGCIWRKDFAPLST